MTMGFLAFILGPLMALLYRLIPNYAVTMIVFTVLVRVAMLPLAIKQQKSTAKMSVYQPLLNEIQEKYKNNREKQSEELMKMQQELEEKTYEASAGGGVVTASVSGKRELKSLTIDPDAVDPDDVEMLEDMIMAAVNQALRQQEEDSAAMMSKLTGGLGGGFPF